MNASPSALMAAECICPAEICGRQGRNVWRQGGRAGDGDARPEARCAEAAECLLLMHPRPPIHHASTTSCTPTLPLPPAQWLKTSPRPTPPTPHLLDSKRLKRPDEPRLELHPCSKQAQRGGGAVAQPAVRRRAPAVHLSACSAGTCSGSRGAASAKLCSRESRVSACFHAQPLLPLGPHKRWAAAHRVCTCCQSQRMLHARRQSNHLLVCRWCEGRQRARFEQG